MLSVLVAFNPFHAEYSWANRLLFLELNCKKLIISGHIYIIWKFFQFNSIQFIYLCLKHTYMQIIIKMQRRPAKGL